MQGPIVRSHVMPKHTPVCRTGDIGRRRVSVEDVNAETKSYFKPHLSSTLPCPISQMEAQTPASKELYWHQVATGLLVSRLLSLFLTLLSLLHNIHFENLESVTLRMLYTVSKCSQSHDLLSSILIRKPGFECILSNVDLPEVYR